jgi:hypothetical protein
MKRKRSAAARVHGTGEPSTEPMRVGQGPSPATVVRGSSRRITTMMAGLSRSTNIRVINRRTGTAPPLTACALHTHPPNPEVVGCLTGRSISGSGAVPYGASPREGPFFQTLLVCWPRRTCSKKSSVPTWPPLRTSCMPSRSGESECARHRGAPGWVAADQVRA